MNHTNEKYKSTIGFIDILFNILLGFAFLFIIAFILISPTTKEEDFERKAEFVAVLEWDSKVKDDIDLYIRDPNNNTCSFRQPVSGFMHLDKDDLGQRNDMTVENGKVKQVYINREVITIRGIVGGWYTVNAHFYSDYNKVIKKPINAKLSLYKVNPYSRIYEGEKDLTMRGDEVTFVRFKLDALGKVVETNTNLFIDMVAYKAQSLPPSFGQ
tara:strand:- start:15901 stop:16539 length:639 start_codon:yes stop_codon:yes gene_type:complete